MRFIRWTPMVLLAVMGCGPNGNEDGGVKQDGAAIFDAAQPVDASTTKRDFAHPEEDAAGLAVDAADDDAAESDAAENDAAENNDCSAPTILPVKVADDPFATVIGVTKTDHHLILFTPTESDAGSAVKLTAIQLSAGKAEATIGPDPAEGAAAAVSGDIVFLWSEIDEATNLGKLTIWKSGTTLTTTPIESSPVGLVAVSQDDSKVVFAVDKQLTPDGGQVWFRLCPASSGVSLSCTNGKDLNDSPIDAPAPGDSEPTCSPYPIYAAGRVLVVACDDLATGQLISYAEGDGAPVAIGGTNTMPDSLQLSPDRAMVLFVEGSMTKVAPVDGAAAATLMGFLPAPAMLTRDAADAYHVVYLDGLQVMKAPVAAPSAPLMLATGETCAFMAGVTDDAQKFLYVSPYDELSSDGVGTLNYTTLADSNSGHILCSSYCNIQLTSSTTSADGTLAIYADVSGTEPVLKSIPFAATSAVTLGSDPVDFIATAGTHGIYLDRFQQTSDDYIADLYSLDAATGDKILIRAGITLLNALLGGSTVMVSPDGSRVVFSVATGAGVGLYYALAE